MVEGISRTNLQGELVRTSLTPKSIGLAPPRPRRGRGGSGSLASGLGVEMRTQTHLGDQPLEETPVNICNMRTGASLCSRSMQATLCYTHSFIVIDKLASNHFDLQINLYV